MTSTDPGVLALAKAIQDRREQRRLKQSVAAGLAGIELADLRRIEDASLVPSSRVLTAIAGALRTTPDLLHHRADLLAADYDYGTEVPA